MALGKTIRIYLIDGSPTGAVIAEIMNWTGRLVVIPRAQLHELAKREELRRTGLYLLVGQDAESGRDRVYVGEADHVFARLKEHDRDEKKDFWTRAVAITSTDLNLTKAHGRYLESRLIELAVHADQAQIENGNEPALRSLPEPDLAAMEYFLAQVRLVLPVLGFDFLRNSSAARNGHRSPRLVMRDVGAEAVAYEIDGRFVVLKGSTGRRARPPAWASYLGLRERLLKEKKLVPRNDELVEFSQDVEFASPSAAATVIAAANRNGRLTWRIAQTGQTYAEWKHSQLEAAERPDPAG